MTRGNIRIHTSTRRDWVTRGGTQVTGYAILDGAQLGPEELAVRIDGTPPREVPALLDRTNGLFAAIRRDESQVLAIVDHVRSIPLFVVEDAGPPLVTDDPATAVGSVSRVHCAWPKVAELLTALYVTGSDTLLDGVRHVDAGTVLRLPEDDSAPTAQHWYRFRPHQHPRRTGDLVGQAQHVLQQAVVRATEVDPAAQIVIPLSGGLDSMLIARLLAASGVSSDRVLTFTYDVPGGAEAVTASALADSLGYRWEFVPYSHDTWRSLTRRADWADYLQWASSLTATPNPHDLAAVTTLRERGTIDEHAIVMPGHSGDTVGGSWLPGALAHQRSGTRDDVAGALASAHYRFRSPAAVGHMLDQPPEEVSAALRARLERSLPPSEEHMSADEMTALAEEWVWRERQAKYIVNSVRVYEGLGLRCALPWWDRDVVDFWTHIPISSRSGLPLRQELARATGIQEGLAPWRARVEDRVARRTRRLGLEVPAKKMRRAWRARQPARTYANMAQFGLVTPERFARTFTGRETPWAFLAEDTVRSVVPNAVSRWP